MPLSFLQVGATDEEGKRFNGHELHKNLKARGLKSRHLVWRKTGCDPDTEQIQTEKKVKLQQKITRFEYQNNLQSLLYPFAFELPFHKSFIEADLIHYHLIHTGYFSMAALPLLTRQKPSVWTLHDPWAMTGHCIHPFGCERWKIGCGQCPDLKTIFPLEKDSTAMLWRTKKFLYSASKIDIVLASRWMMKMAEQSPLMANFRLHHIPFGIDINQFVPGDRDARKAALGIPNKNVVICLRSNANDFKGLEYILDAFDLLATETPITILAFNQKGHFDRFLGRYHIVEVGWLNDTEEFINVIQAADIFLMPSTAESFGMMAMEAMACGKPTIVFEGTALPEVTFAPEGAISVEKNVQSLVDAIKMLVEDRTKREALGLRARKLALEHYDVNLHVDRITSLYEDTLKRTGSRTR